MYSFIVLNTLLYVTAYFASKKDTIIKFNFTAHY